MMKKVQHKQTEAESLRKSHSKASNAKLTLLMVIACLSLNAVVGGLGLIKWAPNHPIITVCTIIAGIVFILSFLGVNAFKR